MMKKDMRVDNLFVAYKELRESDTNSDRIIMDMVQDLRRDIIFGFDSIPETTAEQIYTLAYERLREIRRETIKW